MAALPVAAAVASPAGTVASNIARVASLRTTLVLTPAELAVPNTNAGTSYMTLLRNERHSLQSLYCGSSVVPPTKMNRPGVFSAAGGPLLSLKNEGSMAGFG